MPSMPGARVFANWWPSSTTNEKAPEHVRSRRTPDYGRGKGPMSEASFELDPVDPIGAALGRRAVERELDEREQEWQAVARGELDVDEAAKQRRAAGDDDATIERAIAYFRPFDEGETESLVDSLLARVGEVAAEHKAETEVEPEGQAEVVPLRRPDPAPAPAPEQKHDPGSSGFWWIPAGLLLAAAAAIVMWWVWPPSAELSNGNGQQIARAELPAYVLETDGGLKQLRSDSES